MRRTVTRRPWLAALGLPCALLAGACSATGTEGGVDDAGGRVGVAVAPLEGVDVAQCTYHVELLAEDAPGTGTFSPYVDERRESDGPAGSWSAVKPCLAGRSTADVRVK